LSPSPYCPEGAMQKSQFIAELKNVLEFDQIALEEKSIFKEIPGYDSLSVMSIIAFVDEKFAKKLTAKQLQSLTTVKSLMDLIGPENFQN
jgi:acyl carrier protein